MALKKNEKKKITTSLIALGLAAVTVIGGTFAYLTDHGSVTNTFTHDNDNVKIEGTEPNWDPDEDGNPGGTAEHVQPTQQYAKDPQIKNVGDVDIFSYIEVAVPVADAIYVNADGVRQNSGNPAHIELFEFDATGKTTQTLTDGIGKSEQNDKWTLMYSKEMTVNGALKKVYTFSYNEILAPQQSTTPLFDKITFANVIEGQLGEDVQLDVDINFFAVQALNTGDNGASIPAQAKNAYNKYIEQNEGQDGAVINNLK